MGVGLLMELLRSLEKMRGGGSVTRLEWPPLALREPACPWVSILCGLPSSRPSSIFSTPRHRFGVVHGSGVSPGFLGLSGLTLSSEQNFHYSRVSIETSTLERCSAVPIWLVRVDVIPPEQYLHHSLFPILSSLVEWCFTVPILTIGVDVVPSE